MELKPMDGKKSFYGKAQVVKEWSGAYTLKSYDTSVAYIDDDGKFHRLWSGYSATTMRHVNAFLAAFGIDGGGKSWWDKQPIDRDGGYWIPKAI